MRKAFVVIASAALLPIATIYLDRFVAWLAAIIHRALPAGRVKDFLARH